MSYSLVQLNSDTTWTELRAESHNPVVTSDTCHKWGPQEINTPAILTTHMGFVQTSLRFNKMNHGTPESTSQLWFMTQATIQERQVEAMSRTRYRWKLSKASMPSLGMPPSQHLDMFTNLDVSQTHFFKRFFNENFIMGVPG